MGGKISPKLYGVVSSPTSFWIDHKGIIRSRSVGFNVAHVPEMEQKIEKMLEDRKLKKESLQPPTSPDASASSCPRGEDPA